MKEYIKAGNNLYEMQIKEYRDVNLRVDKDGWGSFVCSLPDSFVIECVDEMQIVVVDYGISLATSGIKIRSIKKINDLFEINYYMSLKNNHRIPIFDLRVIS